MKRINHYVKFVFTILTFLIVNESFAQVHVRGVIKDDNNQPLEGVAVTEEGTQNGILSDLKGEYRIVAKKDATLVFTFVGFQPQKVDLIKYTIDPDGIMKINVTLGEKANTELDEVVVVGFGEQKKESVVSSITTINPRELKGPTSNLTTMLAGRIAVMVAFQRSGEPGLDNADFFIRGLGTFGTGKVDPLILIDGIESSPTDMARLQPDDIASFSVLKDATAAAVYGARGANGVVVITTKTGVDGKASFMARSETRVSSNTRNFKMSNNIDYMNLANEAALTRDPLAVLPYNQSKIDHTERGDNPLLYPNNNWIDQLIKKYTVNQAYNISASGGSQRMKYYVAGTYNVDNGVLKVNGTNNFNNNIKLRTYSIRMNINLNLTKTTEAIARMYGVFDDYNGPIDGGGDIFNRAIWSNPVKFPAIYPPSELPFIKHPLFGGAITGFGSRTLLTNPYANMVRGYQIYKNSTINPQLELKQDFSFLLKGLSARAMGYVQRFSHFQVSRGYNPFYYSATPDPSNHDHLILNVLNDGSTNSVGTTGTEFLGYDEGGKDLNSKIYLETAMNYSQKFSDKHDVSGMLIYYISSFESGNAGSVQSSLAQRNVGLSGRFTYGYDRRYMFEFDFGYNGSERFAMNHKFGFFPSAGLAYNISNEKFFEPIKHIVSNLKLRATYGLVGNDQIGNTGDRFFYLSNVNLTDGNFGSTFGQDFGYYRDGVSISRYANLDISWERSTQINLGFDMTLLNGIDITADFYRQRRRDILQTRSFIGATMGLLSSPQANNGEAESRGVDLSINYNKQINKNLWTQLRGTFTYASSKYLKYDENEYPKNEFYLSHVGQSLSQTWGYIANRLFVDQKEVDNSPKQIGEYMGGDIKYVDVNDDGIINSLDMVPIGYPTVPEIQFGFGGTVGFKNFDLSVYFQGSARSSFFINSENISPFVINGGAQNGLLQVINEDHWSEDNRDSYAFWPRLSDIFIENNNQTSTWWMRDGTFLRFKQLEFGWTMPDRWLTRYGFHNVRVYFTSTNLMVWSKFKMWDPEMGGNGLGYPIQLVMNGGIQFQF